MRLPSPSALGLIGRFRDEQSAAAEFNVVAVLMVRVARDAVKHRALDIGLRCRHEFCTRAARAVLGSTDGPFWPVWANSCTVCMVGLIKLAVLLSVSTDSRIGIMQPGEDGELTCEEALVDPGLVELRSIFGGFEIVDAFLAADARLPFTWLPLLLMK